MKPLLSYLGIGLDGVDSVHALVESDRSLKGMGKLLTRFLQVMEVSTEVCTQLIRVIEHNECTAPTSISNTQFFYFDPNAMDSRCQTHATYVWESLLYFSSHKQLLGTFNQLIANQVCVLAALLEILNKMQTQGLKDQREDIAKKVMDALSETNIYGLLDKMEASSEVARRLQMMHVYFFLSHRRDHNSVVLPANVALLTKQLLNNKSVYHHLKLEACDHAKFLEEKWEELFKGGMDCHSYLKSFVVNYNYWASNKLPIMTFITRHCPVHGKHSVKGTINWSNNIKPIETHEQLQQLSEMEGATLFMDSNLYNSQQMHPLSIIFSFESKPTSYNPNICSLEGWKDTINNINFANLVLSYAYCHQNPSDFQQPPPFRFLPGCQLADESLALVKHVYAGIVPPEEIAWQCK